MHPLPLLPYSQTHLTDAICASLSAKPGGCIITDMPCSEDDNALEALSHALGIPLLEKDNLREGMVCRVEVEHRANRPYASTSLHFPGHTDCVDYAEPPDTVLLLCEQPAARGGESFAAHLDDFLPLLSPDDIFALHDAQFYFRFGYFPVLTLKQRQVRIRYNRIMLELFKPEQNPETEALLDRLDQAIAAVSFQFSLKRGDCLILNNHTTVHGRGAFSDDQSDDKRDRTRLLKRSRLDLHPP